MTLVAQRRPCAECPWRRDVEPGQFGPDRFRALAGTAEDRSTTLFACHKSAEGGEIVCAGFLARGAEHNLSVRFAYARGELEPLDRGEGFDLVEDYREMAVRNGVPADAPELENCR